MSSRSFIAACFTAAPLLAAPAAADMGQIHVGLEGVSVSESAQKAIILNNDREEVLILGTELQASRATPVVRFIPFPSEPQVALAPPGEFRRLAELVAKYRLQYAFTIQSKGGAAEVRESGVEVHLSARLGAHDLTVIRIRDVAAFRQWVIGYFHKKGMRAAGQFKEAEAVAADYVARGIDWFVLDAVELSAAKRFVDPVAYRFKTASLYYPLKTSNTFGGKGDIELFIAAPTTLCAPGSNILYRELDQAVDADGRTAGPCLGLRVKASTSALLVPEERDAEKLLPDAGAFFGGRPVFLQAIRYSGDYKFENDVMLPMPAGVAKALAAPEPEDWHTPWNTGALLNPEERTPCRKAPDKGPCKGLFKKFYFDPQTKSCQAFFWGGCQGEVPFDTREDCEKICTTQPPGH